MTNKKNLKIADAISLLKEWEKDGIYKIPRYKFADYNWLRRKMTQLSKRRIQNILGCVACVPDSACPPGTTGYALKQYMLFDKTNCIAEYPTDDELRYCFLVEGDTGKDVAVFQYECDEDGGVPVYNGIRIPLVWLTNPSFDKVKEDIQKTVYVELCRDIYRREKELEDRKKGKDFMYGRVSWFLEDKAIGKLEVKEEN